MSWRHPHKARDKATAVAIRLARNTVHPKGALLMEEHAGFFHVELRVVGLNTKKESILSRPTEYRHIEDRVIRHWQLVQSQHSEYPGQSGAKHCRFERDRNVCGPAMNGPSADVVR